MFVFQGTFSAHVVQPGPGGARLGSAALFVKAAKHCDTHLITCRRAGTDGWPKADAAFA